MSELEQRLRAQDAAVAAYHKYLQAKKDVAWLHTLAELARIYQAEGYEAAEEWLCRSPR